MALSFKFKEDVWGRPPEMGAMCRFSIRKFALVNFDDVRTFGKEMRIVWVVVHKNGGQFSFCAFEQKRLCSDGRNVVRAGAKKEVMSHLWCCYGEVTEMLRGGTDEAV